MRSRLIASFALVACNSGNLLGTPDASDDAAPDDVFVPPDVTVDAADSSADTSVADVQDASVIDAPKEAAPPPLWWEQTTNGHYGTGFALGSSLDVLVGGGSPFYLERFDALGNPTWKKYGYPQTSNTYGSVTSVGFDSTSAILAAASLDGTVDVGGGNITAQGQQTYFVKYDASGNYVWELGPFPITISSIAVDAQNGFIACGSLDGSTNLGLGSVAPNGGSDALVLHVSSSGSVTAAKTFGDSAIQRVQTCVLDSSGGVAMIGAFEGSADFGGGSLTGASSGSFSNTGGANVFIARLDSSLAYKNAIAFDATEALGYAIAIDGSGNVLFGGNTRTSIDLGGGTLTPNGGNYAAFAGALTSALSYSWGKLFDNSGGVTSIAVDATGAALWGGSFSQSIDVGCGQQTGSYGSFFARFDNKGACLSTSVATHATITGMGFMAKSDWAVGGYVQGTATFPGLPQFGGCNNCTYDGYAVRFAP